MTSRQFLGEMTTMRLLFLAISVLFAVPFVALAQDPKIKLPTNYKSEFTNYLSLDRVQNHDQIIRLFANDIAMKGMNDGSEFPYGSVLVAEVYKAKKDANGEVVKSELGRRVRDKFALIAVMEKQPGWGDGFEAQYKNGDWDFAAFKPDGSVAASKDLNACRSCHAPLTKSDHVFSFEHIGEP